MALNFDEDVLDGYHYYFEYSSDSEEIVSEIEARLKEGRPLLRDMPLDEFMKSYKYSGSTLAEYADVPYDPDMEGYPGWGAIYWLQDNVDTLVFHIEKFLKIAEEEHAFEPEKYIPEEGDEDFIPEDVVDGYWPPEISPEARPVIEATQEQATILLEYLNKAIEQHEAKKRAEEERKEMLESLARKTREEPEVNDFYATTRREYLQYNRPESWLEMCKDGTASDYLKGIQESCDKYFDNQFELRVARAVNGKDIPFLESVQIRNSIKNEIYEELIASLSR